MQKSRKFTEILQNLKEKKTNFEIGAVQRFVNLEDLEKCCKMSIWLQKSASIQPGTSLPKFQGRVSFTVSFTYGSYRAKSAAQPGRPTLHRPHCLGRVHVQFDGHVCWSPNEKGEPVCEVVNALDQRMRQQNAVNYGKIREAAAKMRHV